MDMGRLPLKMKPILRTAAGAGIPLLAIGRRA
jgi:hypothetical protein